MIRIALLSLFLCGCATNVVPFRIESAREQVAQSRYELYEWADIQAERQKSILKTIENCETWPTQDIRDTIAGVDAERDKADFWLTGLQTAENQLLIAEKESEERGLW